MISAWIEKAEHDLRNAEHTLTIDPDCPYDTACFHAQQCAEKYLKAVILSQGIERPRTHDLRVLMQLLPVELRAGLELRDVISLNRYAVEARYPGDWEPIAREEAERAVQIGRTVRDFAGRFSNLGNEVTCLCHPGSLLDPIRY